MLSTDPLKDTPAQLVADDNLYVVFVLQMRESVG